MNERSLADVLREIEERHTGVRSADAAARVRARLADGRAKEGETELRYTIPDVWENHLFVSLCCRYGLVPYRIPRMHRPTVLVRAPESFFQAVVWPEFNALADALRSHLMRVIVHGAIADALPADPDGSDVRWPT